MNIVAGLQRAARCFGDSPAVVDGDTRYTWCGFDTRTRQAAAGLRGLGLGPGDRVAILMLNSFRYLELYYSVLRIGGTVVPLNTRLSPPELAYMLDDSESSVLVVDDAFVPIVSTITRNAATVRHLMYAGTASAPVGLIDYEALLREPTPDSDVPDVVPDDDDLAVITYTGGTTGAAKGVMLTHGNMTSNAMHSAVHMRCGQDIKFLHTAPMFHLADGLFIVLVTMLGGCHTFLPVFNPITVLETIERERVTECMLVPTMINALIQVPTVGSYDLSHWRLLVYGGSPMAPELLRRTMALLPCDLGQAYGQTEAAPCLTWLSAEAHRAIRDAEPGSEWEPRAASCGQPMVDVEVRVVDDQDRDVAAGEIGEIIARGPNVMKGYWHRPEDTAEALRDGWLRTGDLATVDAHNYLKVVDRKKDMIVSGGENVYSVEVEAALFAHPAVLEVAVVGAPDPIWGERVHAVVALKPGHDVTAEELIVACRGLIAKYKVPRSIEFIDALPKSGAGKILKRELRDKYWATETRLVG
jgi:long-chain acyl-CoA synthetase